MQVVLVMFRSDGERRSFSVVRNMTVIGRREDCDLRIPVSDVSRKHCRLVRTDDGIRIEDLGSSNGTYVNAQRIQESELNPGDVLGIGPVQFTVQIDGVPSDDQLQPPSAEQPEMSAPAQSPAPAEEMGSELTQLEEIPAEDNFAIEEEPAVVEDEAPVEHLEEVATEQHTPLNLDEDSLTGLPEIPTDEHLGDEEFTIEEEPAQPEAEAAMAEPVAEPETSHQETAEQPALPQVSAEVPLDDFEELTLDGPSLEPLDGVEIEAPAPPAQPETHSILTEPAPEAQGEYEELELDEEPVPLDGSKQSAPVEPAATSGGDHLEGELELDESDLMELADEVPAAAPVTPAAEAPAPVVPTPLEMSKTEPAYDEVSIDSEAEEFEELALDDAPAATNEAGESSWDFVIEEADNTRSHHDFKLDLDSPHEQPHG